MVSLKRSTSAKVIDFSPTRATTLWSTGGVLQAAMSNKQPIARIAKRVETGSVLPAQAGIQPVSFRRKRQPPEFQTAS